MTASHLPQAFLLVRPFPEASSRTFLYYLLSCYPRLMTLDASQKQVGSFCCINWKFLPLRMERICSTQVPWVLSVTLSRRGRRVEYKEEEVCLGFLLNFQLLFLVVFGWSENTIILKYEIIWNLITHQSLFRLHFIFWKSFFKYFLPLVLWEVVAAWCAQILVEDSIQNHHQ